MRCDRSGPRGFFTRGQENFQKKTTLPFFLVKLSLGPQIWKILESWRLHHYAWTIGRKILAAMVVGTWTRQQQLQHFSFRWFGWPGVCFMVCLLWCFHRWQWHGGGIRPWPSLPSAWRVFLKAPPTNSRSWHLFDRVLVLRWVKWIDFFLQKNDVRYKANPNKMKRW